MRPSASTWMRSQRRMIRRRSWSTISTPSPRSSRTTLIVSSRSSDSRSFMPAAGSSSSRKRGPPASARAISTRRCWPYGSVAAMRSAVAQRARSASAAGPPSRAARRRPRHRPRRSRAPSCRRTAGSAGTSGPRRAGRTRAAVARWPCRPATSTRPAVGRSTPLATFSERRLAAAVGPDQADDLALRDRQVDVVERPDAAELLDDALGDDRRWSFGGRCAHGARSYR